MSEKVMIADVEFAFGEADIARYIRAKLDGGMKPSVACKYEGPLKALFAYLPEGKMVTAPALQQWRRSLEARNLSKATVQSHVKFVNDFLRFMGCAQLCIPKPLRADLTGQVFGSLTAIEPTEKRYQGKRYWRCECACGREIEALSTMLISGHTTSCGCLRTGVLRFHNRYEENTSLRQSLADRPISRIAESGFTGIQARRGRWVAKITYKRVTYRLGAYASLPDAVRARAQAKARVMDDAARIYEETAPQYAEAPHRPEKPVLPKREPAAKQASPARRSDNRSGCPGVSLSYGKWSASISHAGRRYALGAYDCLESAIAIRKQAEALAAAGNAAGLQALSTGRRNTGSAVRQRSHPPDSGKSL